MLYETYTDSSSGDKEQPPLELFNLLRYLLNHNWHDVNARCSFVLMIQLQELPWINGLSWTGLRTIDVSAVSWPFLTIITFEPWDHLAYVRQINSLIHFTIASTSAHRRMRNTN